MKIQWLGHSSFKMTESTEASVITDPYNGEYGLAFPAVSADAVTLSHSHRDHNAAALVRGEPRILDKPGSYEVNGIHIYSIMSYHDERKGALRGKNLVFKFRIDGVDICHLGDIGEELSPMLAELIGSVNVLLIPVGGKYTIGADEAYEYVERLMPDVVIPMHFKTDDLKLDIDDADDFINKFDDDRIVYVEGDTVEFDRADFDGESTKIIVFKKADD